MLQTNLQSEDSACALLLLRTFMADGSPLQTLQRVIQMWPYFPNVPQMAQIGACSQNKAYMPLLMFGNIHNSAASARGMLCNNKVS